MVDMVVMKVKMTMNSKIIKTYSELKTLKTFEERLEYLRLDGIVAQDTFGFDRYLNQIFYKSKEWQDIRNYVISRDLGCDLGIEDYPIFDRIYIHHMNPITKEDIVNKTKYLLSPEYLVCVSYNTHQAIHYGNLERAQKEPVTRTKNDTCPWRH